MDDGDVISRLPDHLLISILSRLTLKEAMVTSVLSLRWEKLWTLYHGNLDFEVSQALCQKGCSNYFKMVNKVLDTLELVEGGGVFDSFTVRFDLCPINSSSVDRWVQFAFEKRTVRRLNIKLHAFSTDCLRYGMFYDFPLLQCFYAQNRNIQALTSISFDRVNVSGEIIEHLFSNCPLLESLDIIESCKQLIHLRVSGETLALKHLVVRMCLDLTTIEISAPNLVSLIYQSIGDTSAKFVVRNAPKLVEFSFGALESPASTTLALRLLSFFPHLQKLDLRICSKEPGDMMKLIELTSLKHFTMRAFGNHSQHIRAWIPLLKAFPVLQKFTLHVFPGVASWAAKGTRDDEKIPSKCLKVVELLGYGNANADINLVMYFLKIIVPLEEIIVRWDPIRNHSVEEAASVVAQLKEIIPKEIKLVFLNPQGHLG